MLFEYFVKGGLPWMMAITLFLLAVLLAAWKAPAWVKEFGIMALVVGVLAFLVGFMYAADSIAKAGDIAPYIVWGGLYIGLITPTYGVIVYFISLVIRIIQKPRI